jgi:hypothetical protein
LLELVGQHAHKLDVIHCHTNWTHLPLLTRLGVPFLTTLPRGFHDNAGSTELARRFADFSKGAAVMALAA